MGKKVATASTVLESQHEADHALLPWKISRWMSLGSPHVEGDIGIFGWLL